MVEGDPAEEDDDFEVELGVVDVVSVALALAVVSVGFNAVVSDSILAATAISSYTVSRRGELNF